MGFCQFFIIFICNTYLILFNAFTAKAADSSYTLTLKHSGRQCASSSGSSTPGSTVQCVASEPFNKFQLECKSSPSLDDDHTIAWYLEPKTKSDDKVTLIESSEKVHVDDDKLNIKNLDLADARTYSCRIMKKGDEKSGVQPIAALYVELQIIPRVYAGRKDVTAIEENPITLNCSVTTSVKVTVVWRVDTPKLNNVTFTESKDRIELQGNDSITNNMLIIKSANMSLDRGNYYCYAQSDYGNSNTSTTFYVRVKSKYAALWPFLGICTEVVILCVIILIYEKKRDKTELEESDTDQGPETKSSPDHGQDNVRYRK